MRASRPARTTSVATGSVPMRSAVISGPVRPSSSSTASGKSSSTPASLSQSMIAPKADGPRIAMPVLTHDPSAVCACVSVVT